MHEETMPSESAWLSRGKFVFLAFAIIGAFFLFGEHRAHVLPWLPWLFLAACPLMHIFMHHGHGGHHRDTIGGSEGQPGALPGRGDTAPSSPGIIDSRIPSPHHHGDRS